MIGFVYAWSKILKDGSMEDRYHKSPEVCTNPAKRKTKVHALAEQGVQSATDAPAQVLFQSAQELRDLEEFQWLQILSTKPCKQPHEK